MDRAARRRRDRELRKEAERLLAKIEDVRSRAREQGWDDVVHELDLAEELVWQADGVQSRKHVQEAARLYAAHAYAGTN